MSVVAQNSSKDDQKVELDFSQSQDAIINHPHAKFAILLPRSSVVFLAHLIKENFPAEKEMQQQASPKLPPRADEAAGLFPAEAVAGKAIEASRTFRPKVAIKTK